MREVSRLPRLLRFLWERGHTGIIASFDWLYCRDQYTEWQSANHLSNIRNRNRTNLAGPADEVRPAHW